MTQESRPTKADELSQRQARVTGRISKNIGFYFMSINPTARQELTRLILSTLDPSKPVSEENTKAPVRCLFTHMTEPSTMFSITVTGDEDEVIFYTDDLDEEAPSEIINKSVELMKKHSATVTLNAIHHTEFNDIADPDESLAINHKETTLVVFKP